MDEKELRLLESIKQELRRGAVVLAVLGQLRREEYGYSLRTRLANGGLKVDEGTLYPLLRRLETQGLLDSEWKIEGSRPRRYYRINEDGMAVLEALQGEWNGLAEAMKGILE